MPEVQTIEKTSKKWKMQILLSSMVMLAGVGLIALLFPTENLRYAFAGTVVFGVGITWQIVIRAIIWWQHG